MTVATWNGAVIAESDETVMVERNHYFPSESVQSEFLRPIDRTSVCPWKGTASYFDIVVDGEVNSSGAWTYESPKAEAEEIRDHVAFWNGVTVGD